MHCTLLIKQSALVWKWMYFSGSEVLKEDWLVVCGNNCSFTVKKIYC